MQTSKPLYTAAALFLALGVYHYRSGPDLSASLQLSEDFDPGRNPKQDIADGLAQAKSSGRRLLIDVGGDWCAWCATMDRFFEANPDVKSLRDKYFVTVKVAVRQNNTYCEALAGLPPIPGYPHFFVLSADGALIESKNTEELEAGDSYDRDKFILFLYQRGAPTPPAAAVGPASGAAH